MNDYKWDEIDLKNEYSASFQTTITDEMMDSFMALSGDKNPLHTDTDFAQMGGFESRVVYGMLASSLYSRLAGMYLPGKYCLLQRVDSHFHKPVYIGDTLTVIGFIKKKVEMGNTLVIAAEIKNQDGEVVNSAKIEAGCLK